ncbi:uncharacterized protein LOC109792722 [Cajanus cajan]|uniref:DUF761 domain-containing protein n=1 Tax=Cajanus cajan TaxID=3821 RepID=A0A151QSY5_CAJCA|nr:uncharacterized protein LOC109792722 [Cajanus cajan]KYP33429.1 hypothetical protein KK1_045714 [Cajanus cajan]
MPTPSSSSSHLTKPSPQQQQPPSTLSSMKLKSLIHTLIVSHMCRIIRALSKVKAAIIEILKGNQSNVNILFPYHNRKHKISKNIIFGSFRLHYNWCSSKSSHVIPVPSRVFQGLPKACDINVKALSDEDSCHDDENLAGYLHWLEEKVHDDDDDDNGINRIDMLAETFIADCHEKFRLEKQESERRFHEMLARGV